MIGAKFVALVFIKWKQNLKLSFTRRKFSGLDGFVKNLPKLIFPPSA